MAHVRIEVNPKVMLGKPVIRGTRIPVELILRKLGEGATEAELLDAYPRLTREDIRAAMTYAASALAHEQNVPVGPYGGQGFRTARIRVTQPCCGGSVHSISGKGTETTSHGNQRLRGWLMSTQSRIEWTEMTWNPTVGCTKISAGCKNCYAETMAKRLQAMGMRGYENGFRLSLMPDRLGEPLARSKPTVYFVNSMSDLFHEKVPFAYIQKVFDVMGQAHQHTFQVLTKRAERMAKFCDGIAVPANVWLGVSVENRKHGLPRIPLLQSINARVRFLSIEPLLEDLGTFDLSGIRWVIVGGESGPRARPMKPAWVDGIKEQCDAAGVAFFFKQWGAWGADGERRSKSANGRQYKGQVWDAMPQPV